MLQDTSHIVIDEQQVSVNQSPDLSFGTGPISCADKSSAISSSPSADVPSE